MASAPCRYELYLESSSCAPGPGDEPSGIWQQEGRESSQAGPGIWLMVFIYTEVDYRNSSIALLTVV